MSEFIRMNIDEIRGAVDAWRRDGVRYAEAVVTATWHSAPRRAGARFLRSESGEIAGNVSAGCVEADLSARLDRLLAGEPATAVTYGVSDEAAHGVGLACGGTIDLWLDVRDPADPVWPALVERLDAREASLLLTDLAERGRNSRWILAADGGVVSRDPEDAPEPPAAAVAAGHAMLATGGVEIVESDGRRTLVEAMPPSRRLVVIGATPIGVALGRLATAVGIETAVIEPRAGYAAALDASAPCDSRWPEEALRDLAPDPSTAIAIVAHDARLDGEALTASLASPAGYIGLLGGKRTREARFAALREDGAADADLARVRAPIGLDLGAETPAEIALAILAQIVAVWRGVA